MMRELGDNNMNINQLETFVMISKTMSFRKAGQRLNLTQPAVSAQIKSLEDEFKTIFIDRSQAIALTDSGQIFLQHALHILEVVNEIKQQLHDVKQTPQGHIVLGTTASIAIRILPHVLSYFQNQFPHIKPTIMSMPSSHVIKHIENGTVDIGISYFTESNQNVITSVLYDDSFELVVCPEHPLAKQQHTTIDALRQIPLILLSPDTAGRKFVEKIFHQHHITPQIIMELSSSEEIKRMTELNLGAGIISTRSVSNELRRGSLYIVHIHELAITHPVHVMYRAGRYINSAMQQFLHDLTELPIRKFIEPTANINQQ